MRCECNGCVALSTARIWFDHFGRVPESRKLCRGCAEEAILGGARKELAPLVTLQTTNLKEKAMSREPKKTPIKLGTDPEFRAYRAYYKKKADVWHLTFIRQGSPRKYLGQLPGNASEQEIKAALRTHKTAGDKKQDVAAPAAEEPPAEGEHVHYWSALADVDDGILMDEVLRRFGANRGKIGDYYLSVERVVRHLTQHTFGPDEGLTACGQRSLHEPTDLLLEPSAVGDVDCEACKSSELYQVVAWARGTAA